VICLDRRCQGRGCRKEESACSILGEEIASSVRMSSGLSQLRQFKEGSKERYQDPKAIYPFGYPYREASAGYIADRKQT
jgi:hypothetical protein